MKCNAEEFIEIAKTLDKAAEEIGIDYVGYTALVQKGMTNGERELIKSIPFALSQTKRVFKRQYRFYKSRYKHGCCDDDGGGNKTNCRKNKR